MSETLYEIVKKKADLEEQLEDYDTYSEELEKVWQDNEIAFAEKVDAYGYVLDDTANRIDFLKAKNKRIKEAIDRLEKIEEKVKTRLNLLTEGMEVIKGKEYNFKRWNSVTRTVNPDKIPLNMKKYNMIIPSEYVPTIVNYMNIQFPDLLNKIRIQYEKPIIPTVTELSKDHPAIIEKVTPSVRRVK